MKFSDHKPFHYRGWDIGQCHITGEWHALPPAYEGLPGEKTYSADCLEELIEILDKEAGEE